MIEIPGNVIKAVEEVLDPGDLAEAVNHGYNPCDLAEQALRAAFEEMGLKEEGQDRRSRMVWLSCGPGKGTHRRYITDWQPVEGSDET